jgi:glycine dehydrogenase
MEHFTHRHIGTHAKVQQQMLDDTGFKTLDELIQKTVPKNIFFGNRLEIDEGRSEAEVLQYAQKLSAKNKLYTNFIGGGYYGTITPSVIKRNLLENPSWYTAYTPYQAEISQGRLEMLLNFQQMIIDLTGLDIANASLLDEATAAAEAMMLAKNFNRKNKSQTLIVDKNLHPQIINILETRAHPIGITLNIADITQVDFNDCFAVILSHIATTGEINDWSKVCHSATQKGVVSIIATDPLALTLLKTPGEMGADIAIGVTQRFGVPLGFGGPHAAFLATKEELKRLIPGRIIGVSKDTLGNQALRMALQTREQHIRRDKATSNICTAQVLLANIAASYAIYHGSSGLKHIASTINTKALNIAKSVAEKYHIVSDTIFDTITIVDKNAQNLYTKALENGINGRLHGDLFSISIDETTSLQDIEKLLTVLGVELQESTQELSKDMLRNSDFLTHPVFNSYTSETEMMRYLKRLEDKDIALNHSMIALGSCTMKLNSATQMMAIGLEGFANLHPLVPEDQAYGYLQLIDELERYLATITGYDSVSLQPNAGSQGEFAGLLAIRNYHKSINQEHRNICLIPSSAHGTNPASAVMAGMKVVVVNCLENGDVDVQDLQEKAQKHKENLSTLMITYPSTHGVFEEEIRNICEIIHNNGGQVYLDGANLNAMIGVTRMGDFGADVSHLNLHKTFAIPHGGGGPGVGPIGVKKHLADFLPGDPQKFGDLAVSAAKYGSASILPISWSYIKLLGKYGLEQATKVAILHANYIAQKLGSYYPILYKNHNDLVAHECIIDIREIKKTTGISEEDVAKRLIDYGFHAPTMSFPVAGTLMIEPTESESKTEIDRFIDAMISIYDEIQEIENGSADVDNNVLKNAPHTAFELVSDWQYPYSREKACYPVKSLQQSKYFPPVKRIDNVYGDRNLFCSCPSIDEFE